MKPGAVTALLACLMLTSFPARAVDPPMSLSIGQAMDLAVENFVTLKLARAESEVARGKELQDTANLLPQLYASVSQTHVFRENIAALGFTGEGFPPLIGPFNVFDARLRLTQSLFDLSDWKRQASSAMHTKAAEFTERLVVEQVAGMAGLGYVEAIRARRAIEAATAGVDLANRLFRLAQERHHAGSATGLEVARAQTRAAEEKLRVIDAQTAFEEALLRLKHVTGIPLSRPVELADLPSLLLKEMPSGVNQAVEEALSARLEMKVAAAELESKEQKVRSERDKRLPSLAADGEIAFSGNTPTNNDHLVGSVGVGVTMPLFDGRKITGRTLEAEGERKKAEARLNDVKTQVEEDVRLALAKLKEATDRVATTLEACDLAERELTLEQDRYRAGVGDNVEVVNAQTILARNQDAKVAAQAQYQLVQINLALALGRLRTIRF